MIVNLTAKTLTAGAVCGALLMGAVPVQAASFGDGASAVLSPAKVAKATGLPEGHENTYLSCNQAIYAGYCFLDGAGSAIVAAQYEPYFLFSMGSRGKGYTTPESAAATVDYAEKFALKDPSSWVERRSPYMVVQRNADDLIFFEAYASVGKVAIRSYCYMKAESLREHKTEGLDCAENIMRAAVKQVNAKQKKAKAKAKAKAKKSRS